MVSPKVTEICIVANLQTLGPIYIAEANGGIFDEKTGMLLAARIVITSGMGTQSIGFGKLNGPIAISDDDSALGCYYFPVRMEQQPLPETFTTGKGSFILCIVFEEIDKNAFREYENVIERVINDHLYKFDFSTTMTGKISQETKNEFSVSLKTVLTDLEDALIFAMQFADGSLYDIGLIASLPDELSIVAKQIILHPSGIEEEAIRDKKALKKLTRSGLVIKQERDGQLWVVPR